MKKISDLLRQIGSLVQSLADEFEADTPSPVEPVVEPANEPVVEPPVELVADSLASKIASTNWPPAIQDFSLAVTEEDKIERANGIIDSTISVGPGHRFLDFGCGEGHVAQAALKFQPAISVGYDVVLPDNKIAVWNQLENNLLLTNSFESVVNNGPYDRILIYDVLDHVDNPVEVLTQLKAVCAPGCSIKIRFHPWCGRHGGHLYKKLNKAFVHLFLTKEEFDSYNVDVKQKVIYPRKTYQSWIDEAEFKTVSCNVERAPIESFFVSDPELVGKFGDLWNKKGLPRDQLEQCFVDYVLKV